MPSAVMSGKASCAYAPCSLGRSERTLEEDMGFASAQTQGVCQRRGEQGVRRRAGVEARRRGPWWRRRAQYLRRRCVYFVNGLILTRAIEHPRSPVRALYGVLPGTASEPQLQLSPSCY